MFYVPANTVGYMGDGKLGREVRTQVNAAATNGAYAVCNATWIVLLGHSILASEPRKPVSRLY